MPTALPWGEWLPEDAEFPVTGKSVKSQLSSVPPQVPPGDGSRPQWEPTFRLAGI